MAMLIFIPVGRISQSVSLLNLEPNCSQPEPLQPWVMKLIKKMQGDEWQNPGEQND
jgi:hypothetical protein